MFGDQDHAAWHDNERLMSVRFEGERWRDNCVNIPVMAQITPVIPLRSKDLSLGVAIAVIDFPREFLCECDVRQK
ncbi:hypothetical protein HBI24_026000 [Parastagonospora nodorum]|nr:hypothetical protein HBH75_005950 [Parastagonospora nodorum]KAH5038233.1 hypothetical protein HBI74_039710 [Parastagonospora nodorum]KAH5572755.1 hypothetical protein HBI26_149900 [Parastagonospora nodorum]KAH5592069.1 hypothetical protein HBI24_026000 [Parastagonospora nodorum]KAH5999842.1 hypothetical protein HBI84_105890 [Parastagonospora nodorum]